MTGRNEELAMVLDAARRSQTGGKAALFTVLGVPGVGKSRLIREATTRLTAEGWSMVRGRCLPYGEGITYWPVAEMLRELVGIAADSTSEDALAKLVAASPDADVADRLARIIGPTDPAQGAVESAETEIAWGFRRLVEHVIESRGPAACLSSRTSTGPSLRCLTSSSTSSPGRATRRCSSWLRRDRSC